MSGVPRGRAAAPSRVLIVLIATAAVACSTAGSAYRDDASLGSLTLGQAKEAVLAAFDDHGRDVQNKPVRVRAMRIRAEQRTVTGDLLEIGEVPLIDRNSGQVTHYWVLFRNGRLAVWGRPEDWRFVAGRYPIRFTPTQTTR